MHYAGSAEGSTLRKTLGPLLAGQLGIQLRRVGPGRRKTFADGGLPADSVPLAGWWSRGG